MSEQHNMHGEQGVEGKQISLKRRGLVAGAAALVAAALASKANVEDVAAQGEGLIVGNGANPPGYQTSTTVTWLASTALASAPTFRATNGFDGTPDAGGDGIQGFTTGTST